MISKSHAFYCVTGATIKLELTGSWEFCCQQLDSCKHLVELILVESHYFVFSLPIDLVLITIDKSLKSPVCEEISKSSLRQKPSVAWLGVFQKTSDLRINLLVWNSRTVTSANAFIWTNALNHTTTIMKIE